MTNEKSTGSAYPNEGQDLVDTVQVDQMQPLPGEAGIPHVAEKPPLDWSGRGLLSLVLMGSTVVLFLAFSIHRCSEGDPSAAAQTTPTRDRPLAATGTPRKLDMTPAPAPRVPALVPGTDEVEPMGVRRTGQEAGSGQTSMTASAPAPPPPEDAPVMVVSSRPGALPKPPAGPEAATDPDDALATASRKLQSHQRQLQDLLDKLTQGESPDIAELSTGATGTTGKANAVQTAAASALFGGQLQGSATPRVAASQLGDRSLILPKGSAFSCALKTRVISATSGLVGCQVQRDVFGDNGRVLLIERGSHLDGEYRSASVRPGSVRIPVLWTRLRTPHGVTVDIESPATGPLGESGMDAHVDNRWGERIGGAMLLSLIDDAVQLVIENQSQGKQAGDSRTIVLPSTTDNTSKLAEQVLESTIQIPPLLYQNQGGIVGIYVARDVDFSSVYELRPVTR
jgi:type IV secretion system protein VirB10